MVGRYNVLLKIVPYFRGHVHFQGCKKKHLQILGFSRVRWVEKSLFFLAKKKQPEAHLSPMISPKTMNPGTFTMRFAVVPRASGKKKRTTKR